MTKIKWLKREEPALYFLQNKKTKKIRQQKKSAMYAEQKCSCTASKWALRGKNDCLTQHEKTFITKLKINKK